MFCARKYVSQHCVQRKFKFWTVGHTRAFLTMKHLLATASVLHFLDMSQEFIVHVDASDLGAGAMLTQKCGTTDATIAYFSNSARFSVSQHRYGATAKDGYAVVLSLQRWRGCPRGRHFTVATDYGTLRYLYSMQDPPNTLA